MSSCKCCLLYKLCDPRATYFTSVSLYFSPRKMAEKRILVSRITVSLKQAALSLIFGSVNVDAYALGDYY